MKFYVKKTFNVPLTYWDKEFSYDGEIELTQEEVDTLVNLIRETGETDVEEMGLEDLEPVLYNKLKDQCYGIVCGAYVLGFLEDGWDLGVDNYHEDPDEFLEKCENDGTFKFEYNKADFLNEDGELDEYALDEAKSEYFDQWIEDQHSKLKGRELRDWYENFVCVNLNDDAIEVPDEVFIPQEIIDMAKMDDNQ